MFVLASILGNAQLLVENFNYTPNDTLAPLNNWTSNGSSTLNKIRVTTGGLTYTGYAGSAIANAAQLLNTGEDLYRNISTNVTSGSVYYSFLFSVDSAKAAGEYFTGFLPSTSGTNFTGRLYVRSNGANIVFGISKSNETPIYSLNTTTYLPNVTYLGVLKYTFNTATTLDDKVSFYVFSSGVPIAEPMSAEVTDTATNKSDLVDLGRVYLRQSTTANGPGLKIDGIRVGTRWNDAPLPVKLSSFNAIGLQNQVNLNWLTATEINSQDFTIERSTDGTNFTAVSTVAAIGNSTKATAYNFVDKNLPTVSTLYYRIKSNSTSGGFEYSSIQKVTLRNVNLAISPNPASNQLLINASGLVKNVELFDMMGKRVYALQNNKTNSVRVDVSKLPNGNYMVKTLVDGESKTQQIAITH